MVRGVLEAHGYEEPIFIGEGSFAKVYRVRDKEGCFWACRVSEYSGQWERECRNWQEIRHPLFPVYREQWTQDGMGYLIIEFWDGMDLRKMLDRRGRLSPVTALNVTLQITEGLQYLHEREHPFLYRDLKPENIRIRENGRAGILDLGCLWNREDAWSGAGNYSYSAPEQFTRGELPGRGKRCLCGRKTSVSDAGRGKGAFENIRQRQKERKVVAQNCGDDYLRRAEKARP